MKKVLLSLIVIIFISSIYAENKEKPKKLPRVEVHKINDQFTKFTVFWSGYFVNALAFDGPDGLVLVDTGIADTGKELKKKILKLYKKSPKYIINTHEHVDHTGANNVFGMAPIIISHKTMRKTMVEDFILSEYGSDSLPDMCFENELVLHLNGEEIILKSFTGSHTESDIIVHFKNAKIIATGDLVYKKAFPSFSAYAGDVFKYGEIVSKLAKYCPKDVILINGHTSDSNYNDLIDYKNMLIETLAITKKTFNNKEGMEYLKNKGIIEKWKKWEKEGYVRANSWFKDNLDVLKNTGPKKIIITRYLYNALKKKGIKGFFSEYEKYKNSPDVKKYDMTYFEFGGFGDYFERKKDFQAAEKIYLYGLKEYPKEKYAYFYLIKFYMNQNKNKLALKYAKKMLIIAPENKWVKRKLKELKNMK